MTFVVHLGISSYAEDPDVRIAMLQAIVQGGHTALVCEIVGERIVEVTASGARWLEPGEAQPILDDVREIYRRFGSHDAYNYDQVDALGLYTVTDLALVMDGTERRGSVALAAGTTAALSHLEDSLQNWPTDSVAAVLHELALEYRFIVHSA